MADRFRVAADSIGAAMQNFQTLVHADWSCHRGKRWAAWATRAERRWEVGAPELVGDASHFRDRLFKDRERGAVLAGFDFPIGVPKQYGRRTGLDGFVALLAALDTQRWQGFAQVADMPHEITVERPFYPASSRKGTKRHSLVEAHAAVAFDDLLRACERKTGDRRAACSVFWTLGGNQVGKAALDGWNTIVKPMAGRGAAIWPFDGELGDLGATGRVVVAETYPGEAYGHVGVSFRPRESKRNQSDRAGKAPAIREWAARNEVIFNSDCLAELTDGFGSDRAGEDRFDALLGLLGMIEVVDGRRSEGRPVDEDVRRWEGWILGQTVPV